MIRMFIEAFLILCVSIGISLGVYAVRTDRMPFFASGPAVRVEDGSDEVKRISIDEAIGHFKNKSALFADARSLADYQLGHIEGAVHLFEQDIDIWLSDFFDNTPPETTIISYCSGEFCDLGKNLAKKLTELGYGKVFYLKDGWGEWQKKGMPVAKE